MHLSIQRRPLPNLAAAFLAFLRAAAFLAGLLLKGKTPQSAPGPLAEWMDYAVLAGAPEPDGKTETVSRERLSLRRGVGLPGAGGHERPVRRRQHRLGRRAAGSEPLKTP